MKRFGFIFFNLFSIFLLFSLVAHFMAWSPSELEPPLSSLPVVKVDPSAVKENKNKKKKEKIVVNSVSFSTSELQSTLAAVSSEGPSTLDSMKNLVAEIAANKPQGFHGLGEGGSGAFGSDGAVGGQGVKDRPPRALVKSVPTYPPEARNRNLSGFVVLKVFIGASGLIEDTQIEQSEPQGFFDSAALKAIRHWKFEPAVAKGRVVAAWMTQKIKFELN